MPELPLSLNVPQSTQKYIQKYLAVSETYLQVPLQSKKQTKAQSSKSSLWSEGYSGWLVVLSTGTRGASSSGQSKKISQKVPIFPNIWQDVIFTAVINSQSLEDTQVGYISQKYTLDNTFWKNTLWKNEQKKCKGAKVLLNWYVFSIFWFERPILRYL